MSCKLPSETEITYRILEELEAYQGIYWKQVRGEFHGNYGEIAIWILLSEAGDIARAHRRFRDVVSPRFYLAHFTVSYSVRTAEGEVLLDFLGDNDEIECAGTTRPLGVNPSLKKTGITVFASCDKPAKARRHIH